MAMRRPVPLLLLFVFIFASCTPARPSGGFSVQARPDGPLYVGDQVSFEVLAPTLRERPNGDIEVRFEGQTLGSAPVTSFGLARRSQATLWWVWDTRDLEPGRHTLAFTHLPGGVTWTETFHLRPAGSMPLPGAGAGWESAASACCTVWYVSGSAAERDLAGLLQTADQESEAVAAQLGTRLPEPITLVFMARLIGHGGFAWDGVYVSYLDGNYLGNQMDILLHHEFVHYYDAVVGGDFRPSILQEGLAVYLSGGHFKPEPLGPRAAALLDLGWYIPLADLADDFYTHQHDVGYLQAGALVQYLVETYGWGAFNEFYRTVPAPEDGILSTALDTAFREHFGLSLPDLEAGYLAYLRLQPVTDEVRTDLQLTVEFYDTVRRYQAALDPSAYFLTAWLPNGAEMRRRGIVADFSRGPGGVDNRLLEGLLGRAQGELFSGDYQAAARTLGWANRLLDLVSGR